MKKKIIASVLAVAFTFSMVGPVGAITDAQYQSLLDQFNQLILLYNQLLAQISGQAATTTTTAPATALCVEEGEIVNINSGYYCCQGLVKIAHGNDAANFTCISPNIEGTIMSIDSQNYTLGIRRLSNEEVTTIHAPISYIVDYTTETPKTISFKDFDIGDGIEAWVERTTMGSYAHGINIIAKTCGQEGEKLNRNPFFGATNKVCCSGLTDIRVSKSYSVCVNCGDGICKYPENSTNCPMDCHISVLPECQWCGKACMRVYPWMFCPEIMPVGLLCKEINGKCTTVPAIPARYACNTSTWQCVINSSGPYTSLSACQDKCQPPTNTSLPDLTISNITADKTTFNIGETTRILATERNIGNNSAGYHNTGIFENNIETPISSMEINTIAPGYGLIIDANYTCFRAGYHTITALADFIHQVPTGEVAESNENNNSKTITINCIAPSTTTTTNTTCTDSDGGDNIYVAGFVTGNYYPTLHSEVLGHGTGTGFTKTFTDYCESNNVLKEFYCVSPNVNTALSSGNEIVDVSYSCPSDYVCQDGACKSATTSRLNSINEVLNKLLNKLKASLISVVELLK